MTREKLAAIALVGTLLAGGGFYFLVHIPLQAAANAMEGQAHSLARQVSVIGNFTNAHSGDKSYWQDLARRQALVDKALPESMGSGRLGAELERLAGRCSISLLEFAPQQEQQAAGYDILPVKLHVRGQYFSLLAFLQGLRDGERLVTVKDMSLQAAAGKIEGTLWLNIYAVSDE